ncbi:MAG: YihY/virulence factor BrkB family protein [Candidatus Tectimicrobiota bacterium]
MHKPNIWEITTQALNDWWQDNCLRLAAALAFYTALSLAPLILLMVGIAGMFIDRHQVAVQLTMQLESLIGAAGGELVQSILNTTTPQEGTIATLISLVMLLIGATAVFGELQTTLNLIWEVQPAPTTGLWGNLLIWFKERLFSLALVCALVFLLLVSLVLSAALALVTASFRGSDQVIWSFLLEGLISVIVLTFIFVLLFKYVPDAKIEWQDVWAGGAVSALLFTIGKTAIGYYIGHASVGSAYGAAGSLVVLLVWVYYSSLLFLFGAEFTHSWARQRHPIIPEDHAVSGAAPQRKGDTGDAPGTVS